MFYYKASTTLNFRYNITIRLQHNIKLSKQLQRTQKSNLITVKENNSINLNSKSSRERPQRTRPVLATSPAFGRPDKARTVRNPARTRLRHGGTMRNAPSASTQSENPCIEPPVNAA